MTNSAAAVTTHLTTPTTPIPSRIRKKKMAYAAANPAITSADTTGATQPFNSVLSVILHARRVLFARQSLAAFATLWPSPPIFPPWETEKSLWLQVGLVGLATALPQSSQRKAAP